MVVDVEEEVETVSRRFGLSRLVEFQISIVSDCDFDFDRSTFYRPPKIM